MLNLLEPSTSSASTSHCNQRDPRQRKRGLRSSSCPSNGLLSLLATVVSTSAASATPVPFLCPGVDDFRDDSLQSRSDLALGKKRRLPDRYTQGADGLWTKASWTLYGSSMCAECQDESAFASMFPTATPTVEIDDTNINATASTSTSTLNPTDSVFLESLPLGWVPVPTERRTGEIIAISLVLALSICFFMACCVLWRKGTKRTKDVEGRPQKQAASRDDLHMVEKGIKSRQKTFARATARWKANARFTFRQRRGKRKNVQYSDNEAADSISQINPTVVDSPSASPPISPRSSFSSIPSTHISALEEVHDTPTSTTEETPSIRISSPMLSASHSPPAYPHDLRSSDRLHPALSSKSELASSPASNLQSRRSSLISSPSDMLMVDHQSMEPLPYHHMGHVATDDKALLERLNQLISAPEAAGFSTRDSTLLAPYWQDEELADFEHLPSSTTGASDHSSATMFPPPPIHSPSSNEKGKGVESYSDEYSYPSQPSYVPSYVFNRDIMDIEPEAGPSAPPFEPASEIFDSGPSAPPIELSSSEHASAPPFLSNDPPTLEDNR